MKKENSQKLFTDEELKILNFSDEELEEILDADALSKTVDMLPDDVDSILDRIDKEFPNDLNGTFEKLAKLSKTDPEFITQIVAMSEIFNSVSPEQTSSVEKISKATMASKLIKEDLAKINSILKKG